MAKKLKEEIRKAYENETPDFRQRIISACENQTQFPARSVAVKKQSFFLRRFVAAASCLLVFIVGLCVGRLLPSAQSVAEAETCVYLDVNPSLELLLDKDNTVLSCEAANEDAETVLNGMRLEGVELKTAINAIVGSMYVNGYLSSSDNSMLISVDTVSESNTSEFLSYITDQVNGVFASSEMECAIIAQSVKADEDLKRRANEQGISVGKMHLLDKMIGSMDSLTQDDISELSGMAIKDLNLLYSQKKDEADKPHDELFSGNVNVDVTENAALNIVLTALEKTAADVEEYNIRILPSKHGGMKVVYTVTLKLYNDETHYVYEVDCKTGEALAVESDHERPTEDKDEGGSLPDDGPPSDHLGGGQYDGGDHG